MIASFIIDNSTELPPSIIFNTNESSKREVRVKGHYNRFEIENYSLSLITMPESTDMEISDSLFLWHKGNLKDKEPITNMCDYKTHEYLLETKKSNRRNITIVKGQQKSIKYYTSNSDVVSDEDFIDTRKSNPRKMALKVTREGSR